MIGERVDEVKAICEAANHNPESYAEQYGSFIA
jgi:hypothetical protein